MPQSGLAVSWLDEGNEEAAESTTVLRGAGYVARRASTGPGLGKRGADADGHADVAPGPGAGVPGRRTITITGHGAVDRLHPPPQRRRAVQRPHERPGFRPDRAAMWAVLLCVLMI
ncbi:MAG: hypothetical protein M3010_02885, partial [Candidatus Dormibacteraeota bacterium]|nr:hypothetical protein [Candidatus Dormibacteraeota bacterium]